MNKGYKKINRNSLSQFKRRRETLFFKSSEAGMIVNPLATIADAEQQVFLGDRITPWKTPKGDGHTYRRDNPNNDKRYRSL